MARRNSVTLMARITAAFMLAAGGMVSVAHAEPATRLRYVVVFEPGSRAQDVTDSIRGADD